MNNPATGRPVSTSQNVPQLLTLDEAAEVLALPGARYVRSLIAKGDLPVTKIGRYPKVRADHLAEYIDRSTSGTSESGSR